MRSNTEEGSTVPDWPSKVLIPRHGVGAKLLVVVVTRVDDGGVVNGAVAAAGRAFRCKALTVEVDLIVIQQHVGLVNQIVLVVAALDNDQLVIGRPILELATFVWVFSPAIIWLSPE